MIPTLIYLFLRRLYKRNPGLISKWLYSTLKILLLAISLLMVGMMVHSQDHRLNYEVIRNGRSAGNFTVVRHQEPNKTSIRLQSTIHTRFIIAVKAESLESAEFENGELISSSFNRFLNGKTMAKKTMKKTDRGYEIQNRYSKESIRVQAIQKNMLTLYYSEPVAGDSVFSDNYQKFIPLRLKAPHVFVLDFPDGSYNVYHFRNGICIEIEVESTMFDATIRLKENSTAGNF